MSPVHVSFDWRWLVRPEIFLAIASVAIAGIPAAASATDSGSMAERLRRVSSMRIYFGHQSVGGNILDGIRELAAEAHVPVRIVAPEAVPAADGSFLVDAYVGRNTEPASKIDAFEHAMEGGWASRAQVAFFKFCYVDFGADTDVQSIFDRYVQMHERLKSRHPETTWLHVTVPLTSPQPGWKGMVKRVIGRDGSRENAKRHEFNQLLRQKYDGREPLFDLAAIESTREDGTAEGFDSNGEQIPSLVPSYTDDGGHLNARGRQRVARALIEFLDRLP